MSTRGCCGWRYKGIDKVAYNHSDSYISYLGVNIAEYVLEHTIEQMIEHFNSVKMVDQNDTTRAGSRWYDVLRDCQGDLEAYSKHGHMTDDKEFLYESLFCEWAYIINLDTQMFEVYKGLQKDAKKAVGRYAKVPKHIKKDPRGYVGVSLITEYSLDTVGLKNQLSILDKMMD